MSKKWTAELDSILLHGVFEECQISFGKALCEKIAARVRNAGIDGFTECTPKAVENRLYSWKKKNVTVASSTAGDFPLATPKKAAPKVKIPATPKTPRAKKGTVKKASSEDADDTEESKGRKRASESEEGEGEAEVKRVKRELTDGEHSEGEVEEEV